MSPYQIRGGVADRQVCPDRRYQVFVRGEKQDQKKYRNGVGDLSGREAAFRLLRALRAMTLEAFLTRVDGCEMLRSLRFRGSGEIPSRGGDLPPSEYDYSEQMARAMRYDRTLAAFVPADDLSGWRG